MSNPFDEGDMDILEGFLCPICKEDLKTPERLTSHVETEHSDEQDLLKSLKDIFSIAKKRIYKNLDDTVDLAKQFDTTLKPNFMQSSNYRTNYIPPTFVQEIGCDCDHMVYFKAIRTPRLERYATDTNKLIIRLHKLLTNLPTDPNQRKQHEQAIVPWLDGKSVKLCPNCAKSFHLARRQHHCRLCGSIMCNDCSSFLDLEDAINLVNPSVSTPTTVEIGDRERDQNGLRVCDHCLHLLDNRREMQDSRTCRPLVMVLYEKVQSVRKEIIPEIPMYLKMVNSLYDGDTIFTINDASALRGKIGRLAEMIDNISKQILQLPCQSGSREEAVKRAIRAECVRFIKEDTLSIPPLPLEAEIAKIRAKRLYETEIMIERERQLTRQAAEKYDLGPGNYSSSVNARSTTGSVKSASGIAVTTLDNWTGYQSTSNAAASNDPLIEQINIIKGYIKQARQAMKFDEVATLEMNLRELQQEFYRKQQTSFNS